MEIIIGVLLLHFQRIRHISQFLPVNINKPHTTKYMLSIHDARLFQNSLMLAEILSDECQNTTVRL